MPFDSLGDIANGLWIVWLISAIIIFIVELFVSGFVIAIFAVGCLGACITAVFGGDVRQQIAVFCVATLFAFFGVRPFFKMFLYRSSSNARTNIEALIGKIARVTEVVDAHEDTGRVKVNGDDWKAVAHQDLLIQKGEKVKILGVDGSKLIVKRINGGV